MSVSADDLRRLALLARVAIDAARVPEIVAQLNGILGHMDVLQAVDLGARSGQKHGEHGMRLREDASEPVKLSSPRSAFAPAERDGFFLVPRLDSHGNAGASVAEDSP